MGTDKALVYYQGKPMLRRVYEAAKAVTDRVYLLTPLHTQQSDDSKRVAQSERYKQILPAECNYLTESQPYRGALYGLSEGLEQISSEWILLLACDLPLLNTKIIQTWIDHLKQVPEETLAVVPKHSPNCSSNWEPMCGFYRDRAITQLKSFLQSGGRSFQKWFSQIKVQPLFITPEVKIMLHNCNTPEDLDVDLV